MKTLVRPAYPDEVSPDTFDFHYRHLKGDGSSDLTVIFITGGPGQLGINVGGVPEGFEAFDFVQIDLRGIGCNVSKTKFDPKRFFTSRNFASDILAVVKDVAPKRYAVFGVSYGTLLATVTSAMAYTRHALLPDFLVLEGVIGRAFAVNEQEDSFAEQWRIVKGSLPSAVARALESEPEPLGVNPETWASWIGENLFSGYLPGIPGFEQYTRGNPLNLELVKMMGSSADREELRESLLNEAQSQQVKQPAEITLLRQWVSCREMYRGDRKSTLEKGELVFGANTGDCAGIALSAPYDSADWQTYVPIFYFQGENDPATPASQAQYHFSSQIHSDRTFVSVLRGGHNALLGNLSDCLSQVWKSLSSKNVSLESALSHCHVKSVVTRQPAT